MRAFRPRGVIIVSAPLAVRRHTVPQTNGILITIHHFSNASSLIKSITTHAENICIAVCKSIMFRCTFPLKWLQRLVAFVLATLFYSPQRNITVPRDHCDSDPFAIVVRRWETRDKLWHFHRKPYNTRCNWLQYGFEDITPRTNVKLSEAGIFSPVAEGRPQKVIGSGKILNGFLKRHGEWLSKYFFPDFPKVPLMQRHPWRLDDCKNSYRI